MGGGVMRSVGVIWEVGVGVMRSVGVRWASQ